ncbi:hypothetical protein SAY86_029567 [Trapa natans]|uniref:Uncharacterized protein n=1 Tax=Trapa natans TaxID=22666 RepID=A0AAN7MLL5_TRANT|nr:hypothetical protein SAY86_029567 [Trapa natans]
MTHHGYAPVGGNGVLYGASASSIGTGVTEVHAISDQEEKCHRCLKGNGNICPDQRKSAIEDNTIGAPSPS